MTKESSELGGEVQRLEAELAERRAEIDRLQAEASALEAECEPLALAAERGDGDAAARLEEHRAEVARVRKRIETLTAATRALQNELDAAVAREETARRAELERQREAAANRRDRAMRRIGELIDEMAPLVAEADAAAREHLNIARSLGCGFSWRAPADVIVGYLAYRCDALVRSHAIPRPALHHRGPMRQLPR